MRCWDGFVHHYPGVPVRYFVRAGPFPRSRERCTGLPFVIRGMFYLLTVNAVRLPFRIRDSRHVLLTYRTVNRTVLTFAVFTSMYAWSGVASGMCLEVSTVRLVQG